MNTSAAIPARIKFAFAEARHAQSHWAKTPLRERLKFIRRARHVIAERCISIATTAGEEFAEAITAQILPLADACRFIERRATKLLSPRALSRQHRPIWLHGVESEVIREPVGVVLIIAPANYPLFLPGVQLFQALAAGNAVLLKPGRGGDAAARALVEICRAAGIDQRLVAVLPSSEAAAREALGLPIDKVFFTGSSEAGKEVLTRLARRVIPAVVELSGCDSAIIRADADLSLAASALAFGLSFNNSATCVAPRRVLVARPLLERLEAELVARICAVPAEGIDARLQNAIVSSIAAGATSLVGGCDAWGALQLPCVLADVHAQMPIAHFDTFAPVLSITAFDSDEEAVALANNCPFGLGASVFARDEAAARAIAARLEAGVVTINDLIVPTADPRVPFGGRKQSGFGVTRGAEGLLAMTQPKVVQTRRGRKRAHLDVGLTKRCVPLFPTFIQLVHGRLTTRLAVFRRLLFGFSK